MRSTRSTLHPCTVATWRQRAATSERAWRSEQDQQPAASGQRTARTERGTAVSSSPRPRRPCAKPQRRNGCWAMEPSEPREPPCAASGFSRKHQRVTPPGRAPTSPPSVCACCHDCRGGASSEQRERRGASQVSRAASPFVRRWESPRFGVTAGGDETSRCDDWQRLLLPPAVATGNVDGTLYPCFGRALPSARKGERSLFF